MSNKHLQRYVNEFAFRYNTKKDGFGEIFGDVLQRACEAGTLPYKELAA